eukprot:CAMPEP_0175039572 /NCGR_PEP_ID=MMETSP0052_2-20121109/675_1 /TAXON_ID=51329 ORGANISM="Polytomella parva, Strain SAG 63-3" /NCGR_SAMPLE_ID=MMETSP0052_2 /ASSEMBLY_ACC=CAM_ASM_000194 /LENGTH=288 /DNA_ID=CAMNT_0016301473 /DNA_START=346 /DNA_END=1212 /DNA_ORIENTATION=-
MLSYILPLPIILASLRTGYAAGWSVMTATMFLLVVLMGPLRAISYVLLHGLMAATLGSLWRRGCNFWLTLFTVGAVRMIGQLTYVGLSSAVMRENFFSFILSNVYAMLDQVAVVINIGGTPSPLVVVIVMLNLTLVNNVTFCFVLQVAYRAFLSRMGYDVGKFPAYIQQVIFGSKVEDVTDLEPDSSHANGGSGSKFISSIANFLATPITGSSNTTPSPNPSSRNSPALPSAAEASTATSTPEAALMYKHVFLPFFTSLDIFLSQTSLSSMLRVEVREEVYQYDVFFS